MKAATLSLGIMAASVCLYSCTGNDSTLSKNEAQAQISHYYDTSFAPMFYTPRYVGTHPLPQNIADLQHDGFIALESTTPDSVKINLLAKARPYIVKEEPYQIQFSPRNIPIEIVSITQDKAANSCEVVYKQKVVGNAFLAAWKPHCLKAGDINKGTAKFVKDKDGWKLSEAWL